LAKREAYTSYTADPGGYYAKATEIYDHKENCFVSGEFRPLRQLDSGAELGYFESAEYANELAIIPIS
jgi:hypothetical protein